MRVQYVSDLHLEFEDNEKFIQTDKMRVEADILILAGDIVPLGKLDRYGWFFDYVARNFKTTYWIPGNHEYYHFDLGAREGFFEVPIRPNVWLVNNFATIVEDVHLIFSTLWTAISPYSATAIERRMNDFRLIRYHGQRLRSGYLQAIHRDSRVFIERELAERTDLKKVVVTHHVPTFTNYPPKYLGDRLNQAFAVELESLIMAFQPDHWIYGHHHQNIPEFNIGKTRLVTNQMGYVCCGEHKLFEWAKTLTV